MPFSSKPRWVIEHPAWPWFVFIANTILIFVAVFSIVLLISQQQKLVFEVNKINQKLADAIMVNQTNIEVVAKKAGVPERKIVKPELPVIPNTK